jgi:hypothetical protein
VGFIGATAVFRAAGVEPPTSDPPEVVGEVDTFAYCRSLHGDTSNAVLVGTSAFSWRCTDRRNDLFQLVELDFDDACKKRYGESIRANNWDGSNPYAWECVED